MDSKNFYITSPIYYVNDVPHIGHAYTSIACDVVARFKRLQALDVYFLTGTDEHGQKVEKSAVARGKNAQEFCDEVSQKFRDLAKIINLSNDDFIRTTEARHKDCAQEFWRILEKNGFIYKGTYEGWYAVRDEAFYAEDEISDGKAPTGAEVTWHKEESYFFKLSEFGDKLLKFYQDNPDFVKPQSRFNEVISFVKNGLKDLSISRNSFEWGVKVPEGEGHVMYVWLDALTNYLSALGFPNSDSELLQKFWHRNSNSPTHIVGKDILRFHAIYWPAFLMAAELPLPKHIYAHGWWTNEGQKISKSIGNVIDPLQELQWLESLECNNEVALDYFRYFLLREVPFGNDGDYSRHNLITRINAELANNIGNLAQRSLSMIFKNNAGRIVDFSEDKAAKELLESAYQLPQQVSQKMTDFAFDQAIFAILTHASKCNEFFNQKAPWLLKKDNKIAEMNMILSIIAENLRIIALILQAFLPNLAPKLLDLLNIDQNERNFECASAKFALKNDHQINEPKALFPRLQFKK